MLVPRLPNAQTANIFLMLQINGQEGIQHCRFLPVSMEYLPRLFSTFFHDKVAKIREHLDNGTTTHELHLPYGHDVEYQHIPFTFFEQVTTEHQLSILTKCAPKLSDLDPMPTSLLLDCLDVVLPSMTDIINDSLVSGVSIILQICYC